MSIGQTRVQPLLLLALCLSSLTCHISGGKTNSAFVAVGNTKKVVSARQMLRQRREETSVELSHLEATSPLIGGDLPFLNRRFLEEEDNADEVDDGDNEVEQDEDDVNDDEDVDNEEEEEEADDAQQDEQEDNAAEDDAPEQDQEQEDAADNDMEEENGQEQVEEEEEAQQVEEEEQVEDEVEQQQQQQDAWDEYNNNYNNHQNNYNNNNNNNDNKYYNNNNNKQYNDNIVSISTRDQVKDKKAYELAMFWLAVISAALCLGLLIAAMVIFSSPEVTSTSWTRGYRDSTKDEPLVLTYRGVTS
ncbi:hypothetical protein IV203_014116 [Nitzschia inconspicua]|uniref:Uncharacterized protein n=1 Tax=Nitzschia inconspicua TaxID=303405 RepID=A0A9K3K585_9STRA|nr:hypothetical protein IV203_014303 [Nitzschia inconspicua]KAG7375021.1 hypothetical protein IV203_014116 [Nitzschia inconspicua]